MSRDAQATSTATRVLVSGWLRPDGADALASYQAAAGPVMKRHGGTVRLKAVPTEAVVGESADLVVLLDFPSSDAVRAAFSDPDYEEAIPLRDAAFSRIDVVDLGAGG